MYLTAENLLSGEHDLLDPRKFSNEQFDTLVELRPGRVIGIGLSNEAQRKRNTYTSRNMAPTSVVVDDPFDGDEPTNVLSEVGSDSTTNEQVPEAEDTHPQAGSSHGDCDIPLIEVNLK